MTGEPIRPVGAGRAAELSAEGASTVQPNPAEVKPRLVAIICDGCGACFELPITAVLNRFTVPCACGWPAWTPRDVWPMDLPGGPLRPTIGARP